MGRDVVSRKFPFICQAAEKPQDVSSKDLTDADLSGVNLINV
jgi:hypothetical protein